MSDALLAPGAASAFTRSLLDLAAALERDEMLLKRAVLDAARAGDSARAATIVAAWLEEPPAAVVARFALLDATKSR